MPIIRKRELRKRRKILKGCNHIALFNGSNKSTAEVTRIRLTLKNAKLYHVPSYLIPPKIGKGYPLIIVVYKTLEDLRQGIESNAAKLDCLGICIDTKWYPTCRLTNKKKNLSKILLSFLILKKEQLSEKRELNPQL